MRAILVAVVFLLVCSSAEAVTLVTPSGQVAQPYQRWADQAKVPTARAQFTLVRSTVPCGGHFGCTDTLTTIWIDPADTEPHVLLYELAHVFDRFVMDDADRATYVGLRGLPSPFLLPDNLIETAADENFSEAYAECGEGIGNATGIGWICGFIRNVAARHSGTTDWSSGRRRVRRHHVRSTSARRGVSTRPSARSTRFAMPHRSR